MHYYIDEVHIFMIVPGDTILHEGVLKTVTSSNIRRGGLGKTIFGDSYKLGTMPVKKVSFIKIK